MLTAHCSLLSPLLTTDGPENKYDSVDAGGPRLRASGLGHFAGLSIHRRQAARQSSETPDGAPPLTPVTVLRCWVRSGQLESSPCCPPHGPAQHCDGGQGGRGSIMCFRRSTLLFSLPGYHRSSVPCSCPSHDSAEARRHASTPHAHLQAQMDDRRPWDARGTPVRRP